MAQSTPQPESRARLSGFDPEVEQPISLAAAGRLPWLVEARDGREVSLPAMRRWANKGLGGIRLEWVTIGNSQFTSREALKRFIDRLTEARARKAGSAAGPAPPGPPPAAEPPRPVPLPDIERARRELEAAGIK